MAVDIVDFGVGLDEDYWWSQVSLHKYDEVYRDELRVYRQIIKKV
jgi:hypothetical protein